MEPIPPFLFKRVMNFGFEISIGEIEQHNHISFYSSSETEINEWIACLTPLLKYYFT